MADRPSIEETKNKGSMTSAEKFKARNEQDNVGREGKAQDHVNSRAEFDEQQKTPGIKEEKLDINVKVAGQDTKTVEHRVVERLLRSCTLRTFDRLNQRYSMLSVFAQCPKCEVKWQMYYRVARMSALSLLASHKM